MKYMRHLLVAAAILSLAGCGQSGDGQNAEMITNVETSLEDTQDPGKVGMSLDLPEAHVDVLPYRLVHIRPLDSYEVSLRLTYADGTPLTRTLELKKSTDSLGSGVAVALRNPDGSIVCTVTQRWGTPGDGVVHYFMEEMTPLDSLTLHATTDGTEVIECYRYNNATIELAYIRGTASEDSAGEVFSTFYENAMSNSNGTLEENREGSAMVRLMSTPEFTNWIVSSVLPPAPKGALAKPACDAECVCGIASICAALKCTFGGNWLNFMCDACFGTSIACAIAAVVTRWDVR
jgi:hypothetical protein